MDNKKIHAVLLGIANKLNFKYKWRIMPDYEIELQSNKITLLARFMKSEVVGGAIDVDVSLYLSSDKLNSMYPECDIYANIAVEGAASHDVSQMIDADAAFNDANFNNSQLMEVAADQLYNNVSSAINYAYTHYIEQNADTIQDYHDSGDAKADNNED